MNEFVKLMDMILYDDTIPKIYKQDVVKRINDWCAAGGSEKDDYVKNQYKYLLRVKKYLREKTL